MLFLFAAFMVATVLAPPFMDSHSYAASLIDKQKRLTSLKSPKLVLVGGSNLALGLDSGVLKERLALEPANMGLTMNLGLAFQLEQVRDHLKPGDIVVISPEYEYFMRNARGNAWIFELPKLMPEAFLWTYRTIGASPQAALAGLSTFGSYLHSKWHYWRQSLQSLVVTKGSSGFSFPANWGEPAFLGRDQFDVYGDLIGYLNQNRPATLALEHWDLSRINPDAIKLLNDFSATATREGVQVLLVPPPLPDTVYERHEGDIERLYKELGERVSIRVIASPQRYRFGRADFFDSYYHLCGAARLVRSRRLADDIKSQIQVASRMGSAAN